jgi:hypothetical protein
LVWYLSYAPNLQNLFGPNGLLPMSAVNEWRGNVPAFTVFSLATTPESLWAIYGVGVAALALMVVGLFSRVSTVVAAVWVISLIWRGPMMNGPGEEILALLIFYIALGPNGASLSLDRLIQKRRGVAGLDRPHWGATTVVRLVQVHTAAIYFASFVAQLKGSAWWIGDGLWGMMARPESRLVDLTASMSQSSWLYALNAWSHFIVVFELCFALLIWNRLARPILLVLAVFYWLTIALVGGYISLAYFMLTAAVAFIPGSVLRNGPAYDLTTAPVTGTPLATR